MSPEEYITELILNLGEVETLELVRVMADEAEAPPFARGEFNPTAVVEWVSRNRNFVVPGMLRVINLGDEAIAYLHRLGVLPVGETRSERNLVVNFPAFSAGVSSYSDVWGFSLSDIAGTSAAFCELTRDIADANAPFGIVLEPPSITIQSGSIQYAVGGSLLASGVGLVIACSAGLVLGPIGFVGGGVLTSAGIIDLALGWRRTATESKKLRSEAHKLDAEEIKLRAEAQKLEAEADKLRTEAKDIRERKHNEPIHQYRTVAYSSLIPRNIVRGEAESLAGC